MLEVRGKGARTRSMARRSPKMPPVRVERPRHAGRSAVLATLALIALASQGLLAQSSPDHRDLAKSRRILGDWERSLRQADGFLTAGESRKAIKRATSVLRDTESRLISGEIADRILGQAFVLRAIGEYQERNFEQARWSWFSALCVWPEAKDLTLNAYGAAGPYFKSLEARGPEDADALRVGLQVGIGADNITAPVKKHTPLPEFPRGQRYRRGSGQIVIQSILGVDGRLRRPVLLGTRGPTTYVSATLERLRAWRYEPARLDGNPVAMGMVLTVTFELR